MTPTCVHGVRLRDPCKRCDEQADLDACGRPRVVGNRYADPSKAAETRIAEWVDAAEYERVRTDLARLRKALDSIAKLGRVCPDFETCRHPACADSCGAVLLALDALNPTETSP